MFILSHYVAVVVLQRRKKGEGEMEGDWPGGGRDRVGRKREVVN